MNHIFISYSRKDQRQVTSFVERLRTHNFEIWQDITGKRSGIPYSVKWFEAIEEAVFTASGAIIFQSDTWERSVPCRQEFQLIQETALPFLSIPLHRLEAETDTVLEEAARWCREQFTSQENSYCRWMVSGAYRVYKGLPVRSYLPSGRRLIRNWKWLRRCSALSAQTDFHGPWTDSLARFLRRARRRLLGDAVKRALFGLALFVMLLWIPLGVSGFKITEISNDSAYLRAIFDSELRRISRYDPVQAMQMMSEFDTAYGEYVQRIWEYGEREYIMKHFGDVFAKVAARDYIIQNSTLADIVSKNYPTAFYASVSDCPADLSSIRAVRENDRYTVTLSENTAQVFLYDKILDTTRQLLLCAIPTQYCFNDTGNELLLAAENEVYLYDLLGEAPPQPLVYNFENIETLAFYENSIYAVTEKGHVVVWDHPFPERMIHRQDITEGVIVQLADGRVLAVYTDDNCIIRNIDNTEEIHPFSLGEMDSNHIAVSSDGLYAAVAYRPEQSGSDWIGLVDLADGSVVRTYDTACTTAGYIFGDGNKSLILTCSDKNKIARLNLETGEIQESAGNTDSPPYSIVAYGSAFCVCDTLGALAVFQSDLEPVEEDRTIGYPAPQKQLAVSPKYECLLTAGRGGNNIQGNNRTSLSGADQDFFVSIDTEPMISTTAVAVNGSGDYAAYGNAGGSIYIWDIGIMERLWTERRIPESITGLRFSEDSKSLYALGSSGTVYRLDIARITAECIPGDSKSVWQMQMGRADQIIQHMDELGLFFNK